jgi:hypothetical protein
MLIDDRWYGDVTISENVNSGLDRAHPRKGHNENEKPDDTLSGKNK